MLVGRTAPSVAAPTRLDGRAVDDGDDRADYQRDRDQPETAETDTRGFAPKDRKHGPEDHEEDRDREGDPAERVELALAKARQRWLSLAAPILIAEVGAPLAAGGVLYQLVSLRVVGAEFLGFVLGGLLVFATSYWAVSRASREVS